MNQQLFFQQTATGISFRSLKRMYRPTVCRRTAKSQTTASFVWGSDAVTVHAGRPPPPSVVATTSMPVRCRC
jgi:hypothetical protein